jgi:hypothetical protein
MRILVSNKGRKELQELQTEWDSIKEEKFHEKQKIFDDYSKKLKKKKINEKLESTLKKHSNSKIFNKNYKLKTLPHSNSGSNYYKTQTNFQTTIYNNSSF